MCTITSPSATSNPPTTPEFKKDCSPTITSGYNAKNTTPLDTGIIHFLFFCSVNYYDRPLESRHGESCLPFVTFGDGRDGRKTRVHLFIIVGVLWFCFVLTLVVYLFPVFFKSFKSWQVW
jgi:hypothetical protein